MELLLQANADVSSVLRIRVDMSGVLRMRVGSAAHFVSSVMHMIICVQCSTTCRQRELDSIEETVRKQ